MARLPARFAARGAAQAFRCRRLRKPIRGRRPRRITRVLRKPTLQIGDLRPQPRDLTTQPLDHRSLLGHQHREMLIRRPTQVHITKFAAQPPTPTPPEQSRNLRDFWISAGKRSRSRRRPHLMESAYLQGEAFRHSFCGTFLPRPRNRLSGQWADPRQRMKPYAYRAPMCRLSSDEIGPHTRDRKARRWHRHLG